MLIGYTQISTCNGVPWPRPVCPKLPEATRPVKPRLSIGTAARNQDAKAKFVLTEVFGSVATRPPQTPEQLIDSIGRPVDIDRKIMKTKTKEVWKYNQTGRGRFALRIILEDGVVIGWDKKS
jgi:hypothetical protein